MIEADGPIFAKTRKTCIKLVKVIFAVCYYLGFSATLLPALMELILVPMYNFLYVILFCLAGIVYSILGIHYYATNAYVDNLKENIETLGREIVKNGRQNKNMTRKLRMIKKYKGNHNKGNAPTSNENMDFGKSVKEIVEKYSDAVE